MRPVRLPLQFGAIKHRIDFPARYQSQRQRQNHRAHFARAALSPFAARPWGRTHSKARVYARRLMPAELSQRARDDY